MTSILTSAEKLFKQQGYHETTMSQIAETANKSLKALELDYPGKEHLALALYQKLSESSYSQSEGIPGGTVAERYFLFLEARLPALNEHEDITSALFAYAMLPKSPISPAMISPAKTDPILKAMRLLVDGADDAPKDKDAENLALLLYSFHFLVMIFWLYDRTESKQASGYFIEFLRDFVKLTRPMMIMPLVSKALNKLTQITLLVFGGAKIVGDSSFDKSSGET